MTQHTNQRENTNQNHHTLFYSMNAITEKVGRDTKEDLGREQIHYWE